MFTDVLEHAAIQNSTRIWKATHHDVILGIGRRHANQRLGICHNSCSYTGRRCACMLVAFIKLLECHRSSTNNRHKLETLTFCDVAIT